MGITYTPRASSVTPPDIEEGEYDLKFLGVQAKAIEGQFSTIEKDDNGKPIPNSYVWPFELLDDAGKVIYDEGEPVEVEKLTSMNTNIKSKTVPGAIKCLKALMTAEEWAEFAKQGELKPDELDAYLTKYPDRALKDEALVGRVVRADVVIKDSGFLAIDGDLRAKKAKRKSKDDTEE